MNTNPHSLVSVVISTYNTAKTIGETIVPALSHTHQAVELIVVDGASTGGTARIIDNFDDHQSKHFVTSPSRNKALSKIWL